MYGDDDDDEVGGKDEDNEKEQTLNENELHLYFCEEHVIYNSVGRP